MKNAEEPGPDRGGLVESERLYRLLAENVADVVWTTDMNLRFTYVSPSVARLRGYTSDETMAQTLEEVLAPPSIETARQALTGAIRESAAAQVEPCGSRTMDLEVTCQGGGTVWAETRIRLLRGPDGRPSGLLGVCRDITDRRRAEERLRCSEAKYRSLVEQSDAGIAVIDLEGRFIVVNRALCRMIGYPEEAVAGRPFFDFLHPDDRERIGRLLQTGLTSTKDRVSLEFRAKRKNGHTVYLHSTPTPIRADDKILGFSAVVIDITRLKRVQQRLLVYQDELRSFAAQLSLAEERTRRRVAVEIHDCISQGLAVCGMTLAALAQSAASASMRKELGEARSLIRKVTDEARSLTFQLSPPQISEIGPETAIRQLAAELQQRHGIPIEFEHDGQSADTEARPAS